MGLSLGGSLCSRWLSLPEGYQYYSLPELRSANNATRTHHAKLSAISRARVMAVATRSASSVASPESVIPDPLVASASPTSGLGGQATSSFGGQAWQRGTRPAGRSPSVQATRSAGRERRGDKHGTYQYIIHRWLAPIWHAYVVADFLQFHER